MKATTLALALTLTACTSSCGGASKPAVNWPTVVSCTEPAQADMLATVQAILLAPEDGDNTTIGDRAVRELEQMAQRHTPHVVACLVDAAVQSYQRAPAAVATQGAEVPPEPERKSLRAAPPSDEPVQTLPDSDDTALHAAARGRDFLERVARTDVREAPKP